MKKILSIVASAVFLFGLSAQAQEEVDYTAGYNFGGVQAGAQATLTHYSLTDLITPQFAIQAGRWFNDKVGARLHVQGYQINSGFQADRFPFLTADQKYSFKDITTDLDLLVNFSNLINPNRASHKWNWYGVVGFGVNYTWDTEEFENVTAMSNGGNYYVGPSQCDDKHASFNGRLGTGVEYNLTNKLALSLEADANYKNDQFNYKWNDRCDWQVAAFVGLTYKFGVKTKKAPEPEPEPYVAPTPAPTPAPVAKPEPAPEPKPVVKEEPKPQPKPVVKEEPLKETIFYKIRMSDPSKAQDTIDKVVAWCNKYPAKSITVSGYADKGTGNPTVNKKYAEQRATRVADAIKANGISADRINVSSYGDTVQPFADNDANRCVIIVGE